MTPTLTIISVLIGIIGTILEHRYSKEAKEKKRDNEINKDIADNDSKALK